MQKQKNWEKLKKELNGTWVDPEGGWGKRRIAGFCSYIIRNSEFRINRERERENLGREKRKTIYFWVNNFAGI